MVADHGEFNGVIAISFHCRASLGKSSTPRVALNKAINPIRAWRR
jgi:hypothetical protein